MSRRPEATTTDDERESLVGAPTHFADPERADGHGHRGPARLDRPGRAVKAMDMADNSDPTVRCAPACTWTGVQF